MGSQMQRGAYSRVCGASTAKHPDALGYAGAGPASHPPVSFSISPPRAALIPLHDFTEEEW